MGEVLLYIVCGVLTYYVIAFIGEVSKGVDFLEYNEIGINSDNTDNKTFLLNFMYMVFVPNLAVLAVYVVKCEEKTFDNIVWLFLIITTVYIYRAIVVCVFKDRKEFYNLRYECIKLICSMSMYFVLYYIFYKNKVRLLIDPKEFIPELWLAVLAATYSLFKACVTKHTRERNIVKEYDKNRYIRRQFYKLYNTYSKQVSFKDEKRELVFLFYAIMIYENFNRDKIMRLLEYIKLRITGYATVGIMQVGSECILSDRVSVEISWNRLIKFYEEYEKSDFKWSDFFDEYLLKYNYSYEYKDSVLHIFDEIKTCI